MPISAPLIFVRRAWLGLLSRWRNAYYRALGVRFHGYAWLQRIEVPRDFSSIEIGTGASLDRGVILLCFAGDDDRPRIRIGGSTYINRHTFIDAVTSVSIGEGCAIGPGCYITDHDHGMDPTRPPLDQPTDAKATTISDFVWIGANATILKGVSIGKGAVIGAGSVVTSDVPDYGVAMGVPARTLRTRRPEPGPSPQAASLGEM